MQRPRIWLTLTLLAAAPFAWAVPGADGHVTSTERLRTAVGVDPGLKEARNLNSYTSRSAAATPESQAP